MALPYLSTLKKEYNAKRSYESCKCKRGCHCVIAIESKKMSIKTQIEQLDHLQHSLICIKGPRNHRSIWEFEVFVLQG